MSALECYETLAHVGAIMHALRDRGHEPKPSPENPELASSGSGAERRGPD